MHTSTTVNVFSIKTEVFEGPLDLLLDLVEKRKLLINDISLAEVTDEYMQAVSHMQELSLPGTAQFVQLAATLLLIKSKSLLPVLELTADEEENIEDLEERLRWYQIFRDAGKSIEQQFGSSVMHHKQFVQPTDPLFITDQYTTLESLQEAMYRVMQELPQEVKKPQVAVRKVISLEEMMTRLQKRIENQMRTKFSELLEQDTEKVTVIVGFLAILESVKQGRVLVAQAERFADIDIEKEGFSIPRYH